MKAQPDLFRVAASLLSTAALLLILTGAASAQLGGGAWPMYKHDLRHSGQSPNLGPLFPSGAPDPAQNVKVWPGVDKIRTSPALSANGSTLYVGLGFFLCAIHAATMTQDWCYHLHADVSDASPAIDQSGFIYLGDRDNTLTKFNPAGTVEWTYNRGFEGDIWTHPAIGANGRIYFAHDQNTHGVGMVTALDPDDGSVKWEYKVGNFIRQSSPAIDKNGVIYLGDLTGYLHAFKENAQGIGERIWKLKVSGTPGITASPVISADSTTLYIGTTAAVPDIPMGLTALDITNAACFGGTPPPCNPVKWTFATNGKVDQTPALATNGTLYVPAMNGGQKRLYAVNPDGTQKWVFGPIASASEMSAYPIVGLDGVVYVGLDKSIYALNAADGAQLWSYATTNFIQASPLIGPCIGGMAVLYLPSRDHNLYAISSPRSCSGGAPVNHPPTANAGPDQSVAVGQVVTFNGSGSHDQDGDPLTLTWNFGDGSGGFGPCAAPASSCVHPTHAYQNPNTNGYTATLAVSDGHVSVSDSVKITVTASGGGGSPGTFQDNFNRGKSDTLAGPSTTGPQWAEAAGNLVIFNNQLNNALRGDNIAVLPDLSGAVQSASADFTSTDNNSGPRLGVLLRFQDARNHYRLYRWAGGANLVRIARMVNGAETILGSIPIALPAVGTPFHLVGSVTGTTLTVTVGTTEISVTDTTYASGAIGVLINPGGTTGPHAVDNFCASIGTATCP